MFIGVIVLFESWYSWTLGEHVGVGRGGVETGPTGEMLLFQKLMN